MNKIKLNTGLASIMLVASIFAGWQTLLLVTLFMFIFCDIEDKVKDVAVKVITFYVGYAIVTIGWDVLISAVNVLTSGIDSVVRAINSYLDIRDQIEVAKLINPILAVKTIADGVVSIMFTLIKIGFVISVLTGKPAKKNSMSSKIDEYVNKALNYVSGNVTVNMNMTPQGATAGAQQSVSPVVPQQPVQPVQPAPGPQVNPVPQGGQPIQPNVNSNNGNQQ